MIKFLPAQLRPEIDDFLFSSVISHQSASKSPTEAQAPVAPRRSNWRAPLAALGAALFLAACQAETAPVSGLERPVQVQRVSFETVGAAREFVGVVRARYETDLAFRVGGKIVSRAINVGDRVRAGDVIARTRSAGPEAAGRERGGRVCGGDLEPVAGCC